MHGAQGPDARLGRQLVLDELFDLTLYESLLQVAPAGLRPILEQLIPIETRHYRFWQEFFGLKIATLDLPRRAKLALLVGLARLLGAPGIHLILEAIEVYGVRKYLAVWRQYEGGPLGAAVRGILEDEFKHEDAVVMADAERQMNPQRVRDIFLGTERRPRGDPGSGQRLLRGVRQHDDRADRRDDGGRRGCAVHGGGRLSRGELRGGGPRYRGCGGGGSSGRRRPRWNPRTRRWPRACGSGSAT